MLTQTDGYLSIKLTGTLAKPDFKVQKFPLKIIGETLGNTTDTITGVIGDIVGELRAATAYVLALPYTAAGYRMAALMSLLPAYQTLLLAAKKQETLFTPKHRVKISRPIMAKCKLDAQFLVKDNEAVRRYCDRLQAEIDASLAKR